MLVLIVACGQEHELLDPVYVAGHAVALTSTINSDAVLGVERTLTLDGQMVEERVVDTGDYPANLADLVESGATDAEGRMYVRSYGMFSDGELVHQFDSIEVARPEPKSSEPSREEGGVPALPRDTSVIAPRLAAKMASEPPDTEVRVRVRPKQEPQTSLRRERAPLGSASMAWADLEREEHQARVQARKDEVAAFNAPLVSHLESLGARNVVSHWLTATVDATVTLSAIPEIAAHADVARVYVDESVLLPAGNWTGADIKHALGLSVDNTNSGYITNEFDGRNGSLPDIRVAIMDGQSFDANHSGFKSSANGSRVISKDTCWSSTSTCSTGLQTPNSDHGTQVAGLAVGDHRDGQVSGQTDAWELDRTGACEECEIRLIQNVNDATPSCQSCALENSIEKVIDYGDVDVLVNTLNTVLGPPATCDSLLDDDGNASNGTVQKAVWDAHNVGVLSVLAAGNRGNSGGCSLDGVGEMMSAFVVGGLGEDLNDCDADSGLYGTCDIWSSSARGGMPITVNGQTYAGEVSQVSAVAPACSQYTYLRGGGFASACGTSFATPQVAGSAAIFADWHFVNLGVTPGVGTLYAWMLLMTDRADGPTTKNTEAFDPVWGGGRFQMRYWGKWNGSDWVGADESGVWGWEASEYNVTPSTGNIPNPMVDNSAEPSTLDQYKAYLVYFEKDNTDAAWVELEIWKGNCVGTGNWLGDDSTKDTKHVVRASESAAAGQQLCAKVVPHHVPSGQTRKVILMQNYSDDVDFR